jgi:hypothetical protein
LGETKIILRKKITASPEKERRLKNYDSFLVPLSIEPMGKIKDIISRIWLTCH